MNIECSNEDLRKDIIGKMQRIWKKALFISIDLPPLPSDEPEMLVLKDIFNKLWVHSTRLFNDNI